MALRPALLEATRRIIDERDSDNSHFEDDELYDYINQAIRFLGTDLEWPLQTAEAIPVTDQAVYVLPTNFISLSDVYYNNNPLIIIDRSDLRTVRPDWQNATAGQPIYAYKSDNAKMGLWPKPSSDYTSNNEVIQIQYIKVPADIEDDITAPDLHSAFHDCLPFYAGFLCEHSMGNDKRAETNLNLYNAQKKVLTARVQKFSEDLKRFRWPRGY